MGNYEVYASHAGTPGLIPDNIKLHVWLLIVIWNLKMEYIYIDIYKIFGVGKPKGLCVGSK